MTQFKNENDVRAFMTATATPQSSLPNESVAQFVNDHLPELIASLEELPSEELSASALNMTNVNAFVNAFVQSPEITNSLSLEEKLSFIQNTQRELFDIIKNEMDKIQDNSALLIGEIDSDSEATFDLDAKAAHRKAVNLHPVLARPETSVSEKTGLAIENLKRQCKMALHRNFQRIEKARQSQGQSPKTQNLSR